MTDEPSNGSEPTDQPRLRGMLQQGTETSRFTISNPDGTVRWEAEVTNAERDVGWEPPAEVQAIWETVDWAIESEGEPTVRKVITVFAVEIDLLGRVSVPEHFAARYDMLREATAADMLMACNQVGEELRADLLATVIQQRSEEALVAELEDNRRRLAERARRS